MKTQNIKGYYRNENGQIERKTIPVVDGQPHSPFGAGYPIYPNGETVELMGWEHEIADEYTTKDAAASDGVFLLPKKQ